MARRSSCRFPPRRVDAAERIERLDEPALHDRWVGDGEHVLPLRLEEIRQSIRGRGSGIECPTKVFACVTQPDFDAVMGKHFFVKRADQRELVAERRWRLALSGREIARELARKPWLALCA